MQEDKRILVVDDEEALRATISQVLADEGYTVTVAANGAEALEIYQKEPFCLVMTDIVMPQFSGIELLNAIKAINPGAQIIVMTSYASLDTALAALRAGAYDYLTKPFEDIDLITSTTERAWEKVQLIQENKKLVAQLQMQTEFLEQANKQLKELAIRDGLTGLHNHRSFQEKMIAELNRAQRYAKPFSLLFIDLDYFKTYNDTNGHLKGDDLLRELAKLFMQTFRKTDIVARYGGDEFAAILPETDKEQTRQLAAKLHQLVAEHPFANRETMPGKRITVSIGSSTYPADGQNTHTLMSHADQVMYAAKISRGSFS